MSKIYNVYFIITNYTYNINSQFLSRFIYTHVGCNGRNSDAGIWKDSELRQILESGRLNLPVAEPLPRSATCIPYHLVGDEAFPLRPTMMKPYPRGRQQLEYNKLVYNYRLSRCRRIVGKHATLTSFLISFSDILSCKSLVMRDIVECRLWSACC